MNMQQLQEQCAELAKMNASFVRVLAALALSAPDKILRVPQAAMEALPPGDTRLEANTEENGDVVFRCVLPPSNIIPLEGPAV